MISAPSQVKTDHSAAGYAGPPCAPVPPSGAAQKKQIPDPPVSAESYALGVTKFAIRVVNMAKESLKVLPLKERVCSDLSQAVCWQPALLEHLQDYYQEEIICLDDESAVDSSAKMSDEAKKIAAGLTDVRNSVASYSCLGEKVIKALQSSGFYFEHLLSPLSVNYLGNRVNPDKVKSQEASLMEFIQECFPAATVYPRQVDRLSQFQDQLPVRIRPLPEADWDGILRKVLSESYQESGINIDLCKAPFFLGAIDPAIADEIAKATLFLEHPASGNLTHGFISHPIQCCVAGHLKLMDREGLERLIDRSEWGIAIDLEPNLNPDGPLSITPGPHQLVMIDYETLMNGRYPDSVQTLLGMGLMSKLLRVCVDEQGRPNAYYHQFGLSDDVSPQQHIENIEALEYAVAGAFFQLGDFTARAVSKHHGLPVEKLEDLYEMDNSHLWGEFMSSGLSYAMRFAAIKEYLDSPEGYTVYKQDVSSGVPKLVKVEDAMTFDGGGEYIVYPPRAFPPEAMMLS